MTSLSDCSRLLTKKSFGQLVIQLTDRCNAHCPQCAMRVSSSFSRSRLEYDRCKEIIDKAAQRGVAALSFTGGEPLLYLDDLTNLIRYADSVGISLTRTGTNGFFLKNPERSDFSDRMKRTADKLADTPLRNFWISIDSADPGTHEEMRGFTGVVKGMEKAIPEFHKRGLYPTANLGINRNLGGKMDNPFARGEVPVNEEQREAYRAAVKSGLRLFFQRVANMGFTIVNFCYPMSITPDQDGLEAVYPATSREHIVSFTRLEKSLIFSALAEVIPEFRDKLRIFTPLSGLHTLAKICAGEKIEPFPCRGGADYFFVNASDGHTYPCGYRGMDDMGDYRHTDPKSYPAVSCTRCDWECFRDPSEFMGPFVHGLRNPLSLLKKYTRSGDYYTLWLKDLSYYTSCDFFNGRLDLKPNRLQKFAMKNSREESVATNLTQPVNSP